MKIHSDVEFKVDSIKDLFGESKPESIPESLKNPENIRYSIKPVSNGYVIFDKKENKDTMFNLNVMGNATLLANAMNLCDSGELIDFYFRSEESITPDFYEHEPIETFDYKLVATENPNIKRNLFSSHISWTNGKKCDLHIEKNGEKFLFSRSNDILLTTFYNILKYDFTERKECSYEECRKQSMRITVVDTSDVIFR